MKVFPSLAIVATIALSTSASSWDPVDRYLESEMKRHRIPGAALVVVERGEIVHAAARGNASSGKAMTIDTPIVIGSLSKAFTATAILQLVERGKVNLDAPVRDYVPWFRVSDEEASARITVRQLLNQTSGIPTMAPRAKGEDPTLEDHVRALSGAELAAKPGERHIYASPNYQVAGLIVERVSGEPFGQYIRRHIFEPLGMKQSFVDIKEAERAGLATGHNLFFGFAVPSTYAWEPDRLPTASIITTARDLARFASSHLGSGPQLLGPDTLPIAHRGSAPAEGFSYAMGWREGTTAGFPSLWHGGALPSYRGAVVLLPGEQRAVVVLTNSSSMFADQTREIASGVVALTNGREPAVLFRSLRRTYLFAALIAVLLVGLQVRAIFRARKVKASRKTLLLTVVFDFGVPLATILFLPAIVKMPWRAMVDGMPDLVAFIAVMLALSVGSGIVKLQRGWRAGSPPPV